MKRVFFSAAASLGLSLPPLAFAQSADPIPTPTAAPAGDLQKTLPRDTRLPLSGPTMPSEVEHPGDSASLLAELHAVNIAEIRQGEIAQERATDSKVRKYAMMLVNDHTAADKLVMQCAQKQGLTLSDDLPLDVQKQIDDLRANQGDFDRDFVSGEAHAHAKVISDVEAAIRASDNEDTKKLCQKLLPKLRTHEAEAKRLDQRLAKQG
jgi:putative membrane protein